MPSSGMWKEWRVVRRVWRAPVSGFFGMSIRERFDSYGTLFRGELLCSGFFFVKRKAGRVSNGSRYRNGGISRNRRID